MLLVKTSSGVIRRECGVAFWSLKYPQATPQAHSLFFWQEVFKPSRLCVGIDFLKTLFLQFNDLCYQVNIVLTNSMRMSTCNAIGGSVEFHPVAFL